MKDQQLAQQILFESLVGMAFLILSMNVMGEEGKKKNAAAHKAPDKEAKIRRL